MTNKNAKTYSKTIKNNTKSTKNEKFFYNENEDKIIVDIIVSATDAIEYIVNYNTN